MRRNRKNSIKKERTIMIASSAFVLAALTLTGIYISGQNAKSQNDGYTLDFTEMESSEEDTSEESDAAEAPAPQASLSPSVPEGELDYMPMEVGSGQITIPGITHVEDDSLSAAAEVLPETEAVPEEPEESAVDAAVLPERSLGFAAEEGLLRPVSGEILMHYSMNNSIYFATLDQYKYNPAVIMAAEQGTAVAACAEGKVIRIYDDVISGKTLVLDIGDGYQAAYGQLTDVKVVADSYVDEGDILGMVAAPSKYYSKEGSNLYFALTKDGAPVNPEVLFR